MKLITKADNLWSFYSNNPEKFEVRDNLIKKYINYVLAIVCLVLIFISGFIPFPVWLVRTAAVVGFVYFGFSIFIGSKEVHNKAGGGVVKGPVIKKFDMRICNEAELINAFNSRDFDTLIAASEADDMSVQLNIEEDKVGKELYLILMKYYSSSDYRSVTDVTVLSGSDYDKWADVLNGYS